METTKNELKPCPCGAKAEAFCFSTYPPKRGIIYVVRCPNCDYKADCLYRTEQEAIDAWNRRVVEADGSEQT